MSPLRRRLIEDMQIRNLTPNTQRVYVGQVVQLARHFRKSPDLLGPDEIRTYLIHLIQQRHLAARSVIVAVAAFRFFYTVTLIYDPSMCCGHAEYALPKGRKSDPTFDVDQFRLDVEACVIIRAIGLPVRSPLQTAPGPSIPISQYMHGRFVV
jgi:hypothetical protein